MSYLVFARKWRPMSFDDVVGQEHVTSTLKKAIEKDRVAHAYVFSGTRGVGKTTTARILARALNCEHGPTPEPCGKCDTCKSIISGSSFDVLEIDGASNNSVDDIRQLRDNVNYTSMGGKHRIYVIDEVHMLSKPAFNALLKTLEEPPKNVIFIFATTEPRKIPDTILSRCQRYDFRRISSERIMGRLVHICTSENITFDPKALALVAQKADGSMRDGLSLLDQVYSFCQDSLDENTVRSVLGLVESEVYGNVMDAIADRKVEPVLDAIQQVLYKGYDLNEFIVGFQEYLRDLLFARIPGVLEHHRVDAAAERIAALAEQTRKFDEGDLLRMTEILKGTETDLRWSSYPRFLVEVALLKMVYMDTTVSVEDVLRAVKTGGGGVAATRTDRPAAPQATEGLKKKDERPIVPPRPASAPVTQSPAPHLIETLSDSAEDNTVASVPVDDDADSFSPADTGEKVDVGKTWPKFLEMLSRDRPNLGAFLSLAGLGSATETSVDVRFAAPYTFQFAEVTKKQNRDTIVSKLRSFAGRHIDLHISKEAPKQNEQSEAPPRPKSTKAVSVSLEDDMENEPIIKSVLDVFDGEVV